MIIKTNTVVSQVFKKRVYKAVQQRALIRPNDAFVSKDKLARKYLQIFWQQRWNMSFDVFTCVCFCCLQKKTWPTPRFCRLHLNATRPDTPDNILPGISPPNASRWPCLPFRPRLLRCLRALVSPCGRCSTPSWHNRLHLRELLAFSLRRPQTRCATPTSTRCDRFHTAETAPFYPLKPPNYGGWVAAPFNVKTKRSC